VDRAVLTCLLLYLGVEGWLHSTELQAV